MAGNTHADELSAGIWNAFADALDKATAPREIIIATVTKNDVANRLVWTEEFGSLAIPLIAFGFSFSYYDTDASGSVQKREDKTQSNEAFQVKVIVPRVGQTVAILDPGGQRRFPLCIGVIQSKNFWQGEG